MDLVGDMLFDQVRSRYADAIRIDRMRPAFRPRTTAVSLLRKSGTAWNADRLWNRMVEYPRWLRTRKKGYDLFHIVDHSYAHLALELPQDRTVVTCHDLDAFRCLLEPHRETRPLWFRKIAARILSGLQRAAHVVFVTETVREEAANFGIVSKEASSVIHNGVDSGNSSDAAEREAGRLLASMSDNPLLLSVGSTVPRKRIDLLLRIFSAVAGEFPSARLVRVGGPFTAPQSEIARKLGIESLIVHLPFLDRDVLSAVYKRAAVLLQPSEAEGFGLPLVEAMVCGCPVVASDLPVLREVGGNAAAYCGVGKISEWMESIVGLLRQREAQSDGWKDVQQRSVENAGRFSWRKAADHMVSRYHQLSRISDPPRIN